MGAKPPSFTTSVTWDISFAHAAAIRSLEALVTAFSVAASPEGEALGVRGLLLGLCLKTNGASTHQCHFLGVAKTTYIERAPGR